MPSSVPAKRPVARFATWLASPSGLAALFIAGLVIRLALVPVEGFPYDMDAFEAWTRRLADRGPWNFYPTGGEEFFVDYPPGYLYVLWILGEVTALFGVAPTEVWLKLPPILADLALAGLVMVAAERLAPSSQRRRPVRHIAASAILFNPAIIFISAVWGQADSVPAALVVAAVLFLVTGPPTWRREAAGMALLSVALGTKPQAGFVLPVVALVLVWRHVTSRIAAADDPLERQRALTVGTLRVVGLGAVGVAAGFLLFVPFQLYPFRALDFYLTSAGLYPVTSVFAFNLWGAVEFWRADSGPGAVEIAGIPASYWGLILFALASVVVINRAWQALRRGQDEGRVLVFGSVAMSLVGFALLTRIHERYLFVSIALAATLIALRRQRIAFVVLSVLYLINVFFPYVYYLEFEARPAPKLWGFFDLFYGTAIDGVRLRVLSALTAAICIFIAWRGWPWLEERASPDEPEPDPVDRDARAAEPDGEVVETPERTPWTLRLHAVSTRGALIALAVLTVAFVSRVVGLGHPPGMYFDEVYHARAGAEYIGGREVFEYTHPPLAKELIALSIRYLSGFSTTEGGELPRDVVPTSLRPRGDGMVWARSTGNTSRIEVGRINGDCELETVATMATTDVRATAAAGTTNAVLVAGADPAGPALARIEGATERWRVPLPGPPRAVSHAGERAYVLTDAGELLTVSREGETQTLATGASALSDESDDDQVWVAFGGQRQLGSWDTSGARKATINLNGEPLAIAAAADTERVFVAVGDEVVSYDTETQTERARFTAATQSFGTVPETTAVWAADGGQLRVIEPHSGVVIGRTSFPRAPDVLTADPTGHRLVGIAGGQLECAGGRPQFAWRLGSSVMGAAMVAFVFLLALRLTGRAWVGLVAALLLTVDGLAFTISRIAMNDSYVTAGILGAWFCALSALHAWGLGADERRSRGATIAWLLGTGLLGGFALASKWVALYGLVGIGLLFLWDGISRGADSIWRIVSHPVAGVSVLGALVGLVPLGLYTLSYLPYFRLGHSFADFARMQEDMYSYHSTLTATHPYGSPWWGWPFGYRAVFLYLSGAGNDRSEIWTVPNLVVFLGGIVALVLLARRAGKERSVAPLIVIGAAAIQYLPWIAVSRVTFMYHYLPVVPFLAIALGWLLVEGLRDVRAQRQIAIGVCTAAVVWFALLYPMYVGWDTPNAYGDAVRNLLRWVIP